MLSEDKELNWDYDDVERELRKALNRSREPKQRRRFKRYIRDIQKRRNY